MSEELLCFHGLKNYSFKMSTTTTTHLLEGPKSRAVTAPNAAEDTEQKELSFPAGGSDHGAAALEASLAASCKSKHTLTKGSRNHTLWPLPQRAENLHPHKKTAHGCL